MMLLLEIRTLEVPREYVKVDDGRNIRIAHHAADAGADAVGIVVVVVVGIVVAVRNNENM